MSNVSITWKLYRARYPCTVEPLYTPIEGHLSNEDTVCSPNHIRRAVYKSTSELETPLYTGQPARFQWCSLYRGSTVHHAYQSYSPCSAEPTHPLLYTPVDRVPHHCCVCVWNRTATETSALDTTEVSVTEQHIHSTAWVHLADQQLKGRKDLREERPNMEDASSHTTDTQ